MDKNRPRSREKNVTGQEGSVYRRGEGLGTGPVGNGGRGAGETSGNASGEIRRSSGGGRSPLGLIAILVIALLGGGGGLGSLLLGGSGSSGSISSGSGQSSYEIIDMLGQGTGTSGGNGTSNGGWAYDRNTGVLNTQVASGARDKRTVIKGDGTDQVTMMVYMCGADLESRSAMATKDLLEMTNANLNDHVNIIVYTGGAKSWKNNYISSSVNQIYQVKNGGLVCLEDNAGTDSMTNPNTLTGFIKYCTENYPANRNELIFWNHGGGSVSGYGYDEKNPTSGSMSLAGINQALKNAGTSFDFVGFDACLMATVETAIMLDQYADYLVASEETEPGIGWYYTNWLNKLCENPGISTLELGKVIVDDFVSECGKSCAGQATTLSVIDLAEVAATVPDALSAFAKDTTNLIQEDSYKTVSDARYQTREFARSSKIDQVDLVHLAKNMGTDSGENLANALLGAVKYNKTSASMTNAYGISAYFPARKASSVDKAVNAYKAIGMDDEYGRCIQAYASMETAGQAAAGGSYSALPSLLEGLGGMTGSSSATTSSAYGNADALTQLFGALVQGQMGGIDIQGLSSSELGFMKERVIDTETMASYVEEHHLDASKLVWSDDETPVMKLTEDQWSLVQELELNVYFDDGEGFLDLGLDNVFDFDDDGNLQGTYDGTWLAINGQPVAYYYDYTVDDGENYTITGHVPAFLNGDRVNLRLVFDNEHPHGYIAGAETQYKNGETETVAKSMLELEEGDTLDFVCDYYSYEGEYQDSYYLGEQLKVTSDMEISNVNIGDSTSAVYRLTDIYGQNYWTQVIPK